MSQVFVEMWIQTVSLAVMPQERAEAHIEGQLAFKFRFQLITSGHSSTELVRKEVFQMSVLKVKNISNIHEQIRHSLMNVEYL